MKVNELLRITVWPKGWSKSAYYRLRSVSSRISGIENFDQELTDQNFNDFLDRVSIQIHPKEYNRYTRTHKTYISELKRYYKYLKTESNEDNRTDY